MEISKNEIERQGLSFDLLTNAQLARWPYALVLNIRCVFANEMEDEIAVITWMLEGPISYW